MYIGNSQIIEIGREASHGYTVVPSSYLGIVTGGEVYERNAVHALYSPEMRYPAGMEYGKVDYGGSAEILLTDPNVMSWAFPDPTTGELPSYTMDCGIVGLPYAVGGTQISPRRMIGSKCDSMSLRLGLDRPVSASFSWQSIDCVSGDTETIIPIGKTYDDMIDSSMWLMNSAILTINSVAAEELIGVDIQVKNNLSPFYPATIGNWNPRSSAYIREGRAEVTCTFTAYDVFDPALRAGMVLGDNADFTLDLTLTDWWNGNTMNIYMTGCFQEDIVEPFAPMESVELKYGIKAGSIYFTITEAS